MNGTELDAAIDQANRIFSRCYRPKDGSPQKRQEASGKSSASLPRGAWPPASLDAEQRFAKPHAKLFPFLGRKVRTPAGPGTLLQVFAHRVTVLLDSQLSKCSFFSHSEVEPVSEEDQSSGGPKIVGFEDTE